MLAIRQREGGSRQHRADILGTFPFAPGIRSFCERKKQFQYVTDLDTDPRFFLGRKFSRVFGDWPANWCSGDKIYTQDPGPFIRHELDIKVVVLSFHPGMVSSRLRRNMPFDCWLNSNGTRSAFGSAGCWFRNMRRRGLQCQQWRVFGTMYASTS